MKKPLIIFSYLVTFFLYSCASNADYSEFGKINFDNNADKNSFTFLVSDEYIASNTKSALL